MPPRKRSYGFKKTSTLLEGQIKATSQSRGFAVSRLLTQWTEVVGAEMASITRPVKISYPRHGLGATLTLLAAPAQAPMVQMQLPRMIEQVNACYGHRAISKISVTQTAPTGFAEGQAVFQPAPKREEVGVAKDVAHKARQTAAPVQDDSLRDALQRLGENVLSRGS